jgi:hypothetical protein
LRKQSLLRLFPKRALLANESVPLHFFQKFHLRKNTPFSLFTRNYVYANSRL